MKSPVYALALVTLTAAGTAAVILPAATAQSDAGAAAPAVPAAAPAPSMVSGLPDFTRLVERVGPAVVNIEAVSGGTATAQAPQQPLPDEMPEFFRRFFGPGSPFPGAPQDPGGRRGMSMGTGFLISADGYVLTNHHVVQGADDIQLVLSELQGEGHPDQAVLSTRNWRVRDLHTKHALLRAGLGWGNLPEHLVRDDVRTGKLVRLKIEAWGDDEHTLYLSAVYRANATIGPAHQWLLAQLEGLCMRDADQPHAELRKARARAKRRS
jgi:hypothetical protein